MRIWNFGGKTFWKKKQFDGKQINSLAHRKITKKKERWIIKSR
jgi:hypothetical protein